MSYVLKPNSYVEASVSNVIVSANRLFKEIILEDEISKKL